MSGQLLKSVPTVVEAVTTAANRGGPFWARLAKAIGYDTSKGTGKALLGFLSSPQFNAAIAANWIGSYIYENYGFKIDSAADWVKVIEIFSEAADASSVLDDPFKRTDINDIEALRATLAWARNFFGSEANAIRAHSMLQAFFEYKTHAVTEGFRLFKL